MSCRYSPCPACRVLEQLAGHSITPGGLIQGPGRLAERTRESSDHLRCGQGCWLWGVATVDRTIYRMEANQGEEVVFGTLGEQFTD